MAEYTEVVKQFKRMCKSISPVKCTRGECLMGCENIGQCRKVAFERPVEFEQKVLQWAAEHPEPVYPTWYEVMAKLGVINGILGDKTLGDHVIDGLIKHRIPADIAQKLGIEPKEGV